ncbi:MAG: hypothetical protein HZA93_21475 [Verrucomicrobia bacterium]|nr:hypothetical protein [Verrucomicrobiota bacterium]
MSDVPVPTNPPPVPPVAEVVMPPLPKPPPASQLTPEEQMAAFEKDLKENDWGHQPC